MAHQPRIGIVGASGYAGGELIRLLAPSTLVEIAYLASETNAGRPVSNAFPGLRNVAVGFSSFEARQAIELCDLIFLAQGNGVAMKLAPDLLAAGKKVIDLSADFRLSDPVAYPEWYRFEHASPDLLQEAVYGLTELNREAVAGARLVANPGCYPTATALALAPLLRAGAIDPDSIVVDAKSGVSGAGRSRVTTDYLFTEIDESVRAYGVASHRHTPEIEQTLGAAAGKAIRLSFTPHLIPMNRGILATCYATAAGNEWDEPRLRGLLEAAYGGEPFVHVLAPGEQPSTKATLGSNQCHIGLVLDRRTGRTIVTSAIDNLVKGAAGQAVQNMNLMLGLPETHALEGGGLWP